MTVRTLIRELEFTPGLMGLTLALSTMMFFASCVAAIPVIYYMQTSRHATATLEVGAEAVDIYNKALEIIQGDPQLRLLKSDDKKLTLEGARGDQHASLKVSRVEAGRSKVIVTADAGGSKDTDKEVALRVIKRICREMKLDCQVSD